MHSHTTRTQAARPAVSAAAVRQRRLRRRLVLGSVLALSRAPVVLARRLPRPLTLGLKAYNPEKERS